MELGLYQLERSPGDPDLITVKGLRYIGEG